MSKRLPLRLDALRAAERGLYFEGAVPLRDMARLRELLVSDAGAADVTLAFHVAGSERYRLDCRIRAELPLRCQRCLDTVDWPLDLDLALGLVRSDAEMARLGHDREPVLIGADGELAIRELVEDELLLALPDFPRHADGCALPAAPPPRDEAPAPAAGTDRGQHPFAGLAELLKH